MTPSETAVPKPDRNLALELVRVTEAAAMAAGRWVGRGDKNDADGVAVNAMRVMISTSNTSMFLVLQRFSYVLATFPTAGLARAVLGPDVNPILLPPGAPPPVDVPRSPTARRILYVGDAVLPTQGLQRPVSAVEIARRAGAEVELDVVSRPGHGPSQPHPSWLRAHRAEGPKIHTLLGDVLATAIPRPRNRYNDLALPIKLFDYLSYGRPLLVTDCVEQASLVSGADAGIVTRDDPSAIADGIVRLASAPPEQIARWSSNAAKAARAASWEDRARTIVNLLAGSR